MYNIIEVHQQFTDNDGNTKIRADISVSTAADLPDDDKLLPDSFALIRQTMEFRVKDVDGNWYPEQSDSSASSLNASLSMSAPKSLGSIRDEQPIEEIEEITEEPAVKDQKKSFVESVEEPEQDGDDDERELL